MNTIFLYSTLGCHLCELALEEIQPCLSGTQWLLKEVDIAEDPELLEQYGTSIPVMHIVASDKRLYWPFDRQAVAELLAHAQATASGHK